MQTRKKRQNREIVDIDKTAIAEHQKKEMNSISGGKSKDTSSKSIEESFIKLDQLYEKELITKEEYISRRNILLDEI